MSAASKRLVWTAVLILGVCDRAIGHIPVQTRTGSMRPSVSEDVAPMQAMAFVARDGAQGQGFLRKPPGRGPFPAVVLLHGGMVRWPTDRLREYAVGTWASRFLAAGYVIAAITYRSRDVDPQSREALDDVLGAVQYVRGLPYVDPMSVVVNGASGGGDLALSLGTEDQVALIIAEEPATVMFTGIVDKNFPKRGERHTPSDAAPILADPKKYYSAAHQQLTREKIARIKSPILLVRGDQHPINRFNSDVFIPELIKAGKQLKILTYPGGEHGFAFYSVPVRTPAPGVREVTSPEMALKAFEDVSAVVKGAVRTPPTPISSDLITPVPF